MNDPYAMYEGFRTMCPVGRSQQHGGFYVASRYETVKKVFEEYSTFSSADGVGIPPHPFKMFPIDLDQPLQAKFRRVLNRRFPPEAVAEKRGEIQQDRKSAMWGKRGSVSVQPGGRRRIKKKK